MKNVYVISLADDGWAKDDKAISMLKKLKKMDDCIFVGDHEDFLQLIREYCKTVNETEKTQGDKVTVEVSHSDLDMSHSVFFFKSGKGIFCSLGFFAIAGVVYGDGHISPLEVVEKSDIRIHICKD